MKPLTNVRFDGDRAVNFDCPRCGKHAIRAALATDRDPPMHGKWVLVSREPITLSPSIQTWCEGSSVHGLVVNGEWVPA